MQTEAVVFVHLAFLNSNKEEEYKRMMGIGVPIPCSIWHVAESSILHVRQEPTQFAIHAVHVFNDITREFEPFEASFEDLRIYPSVKVRIEVNPSLRGSISLYKKDYDRRFPDGRLELAEPENLNPRQEENLCTICCDNPPDAVIVPCGHMGLFTVVSKL
uniref:Uncharacterized protein n=1 Tax=Acrobeloides nanus TaxID=290746 RepID=A0A914E576_9BILA